MTVHLRVTEGPETGRTFTFVERDRFVIGRAPTANFQILNDGYFSRHHAMLDIDPPFVVIQDLGSTNGTRVNDAVIQGPTVMRHGDSISGGSTRIRLEIDAPANPEALVPVRCLLCGAKSPNEPPRPRADKMAFYCEPCQERLIREPRLPPRYQLIKELGRGAMGAVYLVRGPSGDRAMKMMLPKAAMSEKMRKMFLRETSTQASLDHPRIVRMEKELFEPVPGIFCVAMEFVDGTSADRMLAHAPNGLDVAEACTIAIQTLEGLAHAHGLGVVHRDVKEANLMIQSGFGVKLGDFGLAKSFASSGSTLTATSGEIGGTLPYMPPEQILDYRNARPPADIYALGATLYRLLTGQLAYDFKDGNNFVTIIEKPMVPVRTRKPSIPEDVAAVVETAMRKRPEERYATAERMRLALEATHK